MCGIAGCVGHPEAIEFTKQGLALLEYRGYDSAGIAYETEQGIEVVRALGNIANLFEAVDKLPEETHQSSTAIGHTRWGTHGSKKLLRNTHPLANEDETILVVQNGTIDNFLEIKRDLVQQGVNFRSETDTELIPHMLDSFIKRGHSPESAVQETTKQLYGASAFLALFAEEPETIYASNNGGELYFGSQNGSSYIGSDKIVLADYTKQGNGLRNGEALKLTGGSHKIVHLEKGILVTRALEDLQDIPAKPELGSYPHYMLKEIHESPQIVQAAISGRIRPEEKIVKLGGLEQIEQKLSQIKRMIIVGCGTSLHAGMIGKRLFEEIAEMPVEVVQANKFAYSRRPIENGTAILAISQSGTTRDTIAALEKADQHGMLKLGIVNRPGSKIEEMTDAGVHCRAGTEMSVASTKAFTSQVTVLAEMALAIAKRSNTLQQPVMNELVALPDKLQEVLDNEDQIKDLAKKYAHYSDFLFMGRGYEDISALEGALKLKEISYINANGVDAGEMKHGTIALIDENFPTFAIVTNGQQYKKTLSNVQTIKSCDGPVLGLVNIGNTEVKDIVNDVLYVPETVEQLQPIINGVAMQLFAYYVAVERGCNIDQPRNLAKSVTVE